MKNTDNFCYEGKLSHATIKPTPFAVSKDKWDTNKDTGKSMKSVLYVLQYAKRHVLYPAEATLNSEKVKPIALAVMELRLSVSQKLMFNELF